MIQSQNDLSINLPQRTNCDIFTKGQHNTQNYTIINPQLKIHLNNLKQFLKGKFQCWKQDQKFQFELPQTKFDQKRQKPIIQYQSQFFVQQQLDVVPLSDNQIRQIKLLGTFSVNSKKYSTPYKWTLSQLIFKGETKINQTYQNDLGIAFSQLYQIKQRIINKQFSLYRSILDIFGFFIKVFSILFGIKSTTKKLKKQPYVILQLQRQKIILEKQWHSIQKTLYQYLNIPINIQKKQYQKQLKEQADKIKAIRQLENKISQQWQKKKGQLFQIYEQTLSVQQLKKFYAVEKHKLKQNHLQNSKIDKKVLNHLIFFKEQLTILHDLQNQKNRKFRQSIQNFNNQIKDKFKIRSKCQKWYLNIINKHKQKLNQIHQTNFLMQAKRKIKLPQFQDYTIFLTNYAEKQKQIRKRLQIELPLKTFYLEQTILPPYKLIYNPNIFGAEYSLQKFKHRTVKSDHYFWKIQLIIKQSYTWSKNFITFTYQNIVTGRFGIRILIQKKKFYPVHIINTFTGQIGRSSSIQRQPIYINFIQNLKNITFFRKEFQNSPDNGFLGKKSARIFNIFYCYIYILLIKTILYLLLLKPILIIINFVGFAILCGTVIFWMPLIVLITYMFDILIFQYNLPNQNLNPTFAEVYFPLLSTTIVLFIDILLFALNLLCLFLHPLLSLFILIFAILRKCLRKIYDKLMYYFIRYCGRSPVRDTWLAWRIAGPHISQNYLQKIKSGDIFILLQAQLEKIQLQIYESQLKKLLMQPLTNSYQTINQLMQQLITSSIGNNKISQSVNYYISKLSLKISERKSLYPKIHGYNVRFTQNQLNQQMENSRRILKKFMQKKSYIDLFKFFNIKKKNLDKLVSVIWRRIFMSQNVFKPLQDLDERVDVQGKRQNDEVNKFIQDMQNDLLLDENEEYKQFDYNLIEKNIANIEQYERFTFNDIIGYVQPFLGMQLVNCVYSIYNSLFISFNIKHIIKYMQEQRQNE